MTTDRQLVLQFFNEGSVGELAAISGCSKKKAEVVAQIRPFKDWKDIVSCAYLYVCVWDKDWKIIIKSPFLK